MRNTEILIFIFAIGLLGLNWPALEIFRVNVSIYLFVFWLAFIIAVGLASHHTAKRNR